MLKVNDFLNDLKEKCSHISYLCAVHMLEKKYLIEDDKEKIDILKEFLINYDNYAKLLNDYANIIYNRYESSNDEVYEEICGFLGEDSDNKYLFEYRLKRILNQDPTKYLNMEDEDMQKAAILRVIDKINIIESSKYFRENENLASNEIKKLKKTVEIVKNVVGI